VLETAQGSLLEGGGGKGKLPSLPVSFDGNTEVLSLMMDRIGHQYGPIIIGNNPVWVQLTCRKISERAQECN